MKMGDLELSLDDIIKKKFIKAGPIHGRNNAGNMKKSIRRISDPTNRITKNQNNVGLNKNIRNPMLKRGQAPPSGIGDARLKIIQKQRQKMSDARDKLGQIAKQTDARLRLVKLRERQRGIIPGGRVPMQVRSLPEHPTLQRTVQSRMNSGYYEDELMDYATDVSYLSRNYPERAVLDDDYYSYGYRARPDASVLYRTVENDIPVNRLYEPEKNIYSWKKSMHADDLVDIPVSRTSSRIGLGLGQDRRDNRGNTPSWDLDDMPIVITKKIKPQETVGILKRSLSNVYDGQAVKIIKESSPPSKNKAPARTLSERFCQDGNLSAQKISLLKAKLEASQKNKAKAAEAPLGHRIVVSNLVPSVTHEDVKELFEDIGELISSKVVRPGTAEVVYKLHKDAVKAVDVYHNRQLDGQPMKCLLVNNRSALPMAAKSFKGAERKLGKPVVELDMTAFRKALHKKSTS